MMWWGYIHVDGSIHAKRLFSQEDVLEAKLSPFVAKVMEPFDAPDRQSAIHAIQQRFGGQ